MSIRWALIDITIITDYYVQVKGFYRHMKYVNQLAKEGKLTTRHNEDRGKPERCLIKDKSLRQAAVCLNCKRKECVGSKRCFEKGEILEHGKTDKAGEV